MAKFVINKERKAAIPTKSKERRAFDMFVTLDSDFKQVHSRKVIAAECKVSGVVLAGWIREGKWRERLDGALAKARERASTDEELTSLLTTYLYGKEIEKSPDPAEAIKKFNHKKSVRIQKTVNRMGDIIFEVRKYNHRMFRTLMGGKYLTYEERGVYHKAYIDSLDHLFKLFGIGTIRELAAASLDDETRRILQSENVIDNNAGGTKVGVFIGGKNPADVLANGSQVVLDASTHDLVLNIMVGEKKIEGPKTYTGLKSGADIGLIEEAAIVDTKRPDPEGEE